MNLPHDIHCVIIGLLDYDAVFAYKVTSRQANTLVHQVYKRLYFTNNIYDAARNDDHLNFRRLASMVSPKVIVRAAQLTTSVEIIKYALYIALITSNSLVDLMQYPLIINKHALSNAHYTTNNGLVNWMQYPSMTDKHALPSTHYTINTIIRLICSGNFKLLEPYPRGPIYNTIYAAMGLYDYIVPSPSNVNVAFACAAYVSKDQRIIALADKQTYDEIVDVCNGITDPRQACMADMYILCKYAIITDDIDTFNRAFTPDMLYVMFLVEHIIDYNKVNFVPYITDVKIGSVDQHLAVRMTREMAIALIEYLPREDARYLIMRTCNYSLIQMFSERCDIPMMVTRMSYHNDY